MTQRILGESGKGKLFIVSAPAGTGKSTLVHKLLEEFPGAVEQSRSCTTREIRQGEHAGKDYDYLSVEEFEKKIEAGEFLEHAKVFSHYYGTRTEEVDTLLAHGKHVVLVIDTQGARAVRAKRDAVLIFINPPSVEELEQRLFKRKTESTEVIHERLAWAKEEMAQAVHYDYEVVNDDLDTAYQILRSIFIAEEHKKVLKKST